MSQVLNVTCERYGTSLIVERKGDRADIKLEGEDIEQVDRSKYLRKLCYRGRAVFKED